MTHGGGREDESAVLPLSAPAAPRPPPRADPREGLPGAGGRAGDAFGTALGFLPRGRSSGGDFGNSTCSCPEHSSWLQPFPICPGDGQRRSENSLPVRLAPPSRIRFLPRKELALLVQPWPGAHQNSNTMSS